MGHRYSVALVVLALLGSSCMESAGAAHEATLVFAAASLTEVFRELEREFERRHPDRNLELHFAGTPRLVLQVREGAPADVFASADHVHMQRIVALGQTAGAPVPFARNRLAIVTPRGNPNNVRTLADLVRLERVVLCGPEVPAGRYARQALAKAGVEVRSVSDEPSVKSVVSKVGLGEADAGIVYATDAGRNSGAVVAVPIPDAHNVTATYPIVALGSGKSRKGGAAFVAFVQSDAARRVLSRHGFVWP